MQEIHALMQMVGLTGLVLVDHILGCNLDARVKAPVEDRKDLMEQAYRIGKDLLR